MSNDFYRAFEDAHRGSRQDIKQRLQVYLPFVFPIVQAHPAALCLDLGCGRGEWLELLADHGIQAQGVDLDAGMLRAAQAGGLQVSQGDAIGALKKLPDGCASVISAFHLVEHLQFEELQVLVEHARRVLMSDGVLILETPNPDNLQVATSNFHLDPSHIKPLPSLLLAFLVEQTGFGRSKILGLQESPNLRFRQDLQLQDVLAGASPDYGLVAQKVSMPADSDPLALLFDRDYGISTAELASAYTAQQTRLIKDVRLQIQDLLGKIQLLDQRSALLEAEILAIHRSAVWRLSKPLQWLWVQVGKWRREGWRARLAAAHRKMTAPEVGRLRPQDQQLESMAPSTQASTPPQAELTERAREIDARLQPEGREQHNR